jgi:hypothetical protein
MKPSLVVLFAAALPFVAACSKFETKKAAKADPSASQQTAPPRRNAAESLGIASGSSEEYMQPNAAPKPAEPPSDPSPPAAAESASQTAPVSASTAADASKPGIRRTLTATDGRKVEAELLAKNEEAVRIRRAADAREFTIPLERISEEDRNFVRESELPPLAAR